MNVAVFGGSNPTSEDYIQAEQLGRLLAARGHVVLNGGYIGTMEAVSKGAAEAGGKVIGITCDQIEAWRPVRPNRYLTEERRFTTLGERLFALIDGSQAAIALPGGPGTLAEVALTWNLLLTNSLPPRPLVLVGPAWRQTIQGFFEAMSDYIPSSQRDWLTFAEDAAGAVARI